MKELYDLHQKAVGSYTTLHAYIVENAQPELRY